MHVPVRGGTRGGRDQFNWDDVKLDKYKENYIGQTERTIRPTFNCPKPNSLWWTKNDGSSTQQGHPAADIRSVKQEEDQLMLQALGLAPKTRHLPAKPLDKTDFEVLTKRGATERGVYDEAERIEGVGFKPSYNHQGVAGIMPVEGKPPEEGKGWLAKSVASSDGRSSDAAVQRQQTQATSVDAAYPNSTKDDESKREKREKKQKKEKKEKKDKEKKRHRSSSSSEDDRKRSSSHHHHHHHHHRARERSRSRSRSPPRSRDDDRHRSDRHHHASMNRRD